MRRAAALLLCALAATPALAQSKAGDSVMVMIHHVRADKRAQYDSLMEKAWQPAALRAGQKHPAFGKAYAARRRHVPTAMERDSTFTYLYFYPIRPRVPESGLGNDVLAAAGLSKKQIDAFRDGLRSYLVPGSGPVDMVDEPYR